MKNSENNLENQNSKKFYIKDIPLSEKEKIITNILKITDNLQSIYFSCVERIIKSLFIINSGGVVTTLTYIYNKNGHSIF